MSQPVKRTFRNYWSPWHVVVVLVAFVLAAAIFRYTGYADVVLAVGTGAGAAAIGWFFAWLHLRQPKDL